MSINALNDIIDNSVFQDLKEIVPLFPEIETELHLICDNLKQKFIDNGYETYFDNAVENECIIDVFTRAN